MPCHIDRTLLGRSLDGKRFQQRWLSSKYKTSRNCRRWLSGASVPLAAALQTLPCLRGDVCVRIVEGHDYRRWVFEDLKRWLKWAFRNCTFKHYGISRFDSDCHRSAKERTFWIRSDPRHQCQTNVLLSQGPLLTPQHCSFNGSSICITLMTALAMTGQRLIGARITLAK